jgi:hypothetical protein
MLLDTKGHFLYSIFTMNFYLYWYQNLRAADPQQILFTRVDASRLTPFQRKQQQNPFQVIKRHIELRHHELTRHKNS